MQGFAGDGFLVRPAVEEDLDDVLEVYYRSEDFLALGPVPHASTAMVMADLDLSARNGGVYCVIELPDGAVAGVLDYIPGGYEGLAQQAYLELIMIAAPYRGRGLGGRVVAALEQFLRANGVRAVLADVQVNNPDGLRFWRCAGYRVVSPACRQPDGTVTFGLEKMLF